MPSAFISEVKYLGGASLDFIEVAVDAGGPTGGISVVVYNPSGTVRTTNALGTSTGTTGGHDIYVLDTATSGTFNGLHKFGAVALIEDGVVISFISFTDGPPLVATAGPAAGMTSTQIGGAGSGESLQSDDDGATYYTQTTPNSGSIPCFTAGTLIMTPKGQVPIETLKPGMLVNTRDRGAVPLRWIGRRKVTVSKMRKNPKLRPVRIEAGALGNGLPKADILVSRQHRMLVQSTLAEQLFGDREILVPAIKLCGLPGIDLVHSKADVIYLHLLFDHHEVVFVEDAPSESLYRGANGLAALSRGQRAEIRFLFPELEANEAPARPIVERGKMTRALCGAVMSENASLLEGHSGRL